MAVKEIVADIRHLSGEVYYPSPEVLEFPKHPRGYNASNPEACLN
jgi:hypothetical protein